MQIDLIEIKNLYDLGMAIHWLREKSKIPLLGGWTSGPRSTWKQLAESYKPGLNVGVRLGRVSRVNDQGFLAVIDCDVKSTDPKHLDQMLAALKEICPWWDISPVVKSGRGNGSMHVYVLTTEPARAAKLKVSTDVVGVHMPSAKPSKRDIEWVEPEALKKGMRARPAWEICLMGEGQQVVLPPSIHPDSGKPYIWAEKSEKSPPLLFDIGGLSVTTKVPDKPSEFKFNVVENVDLGRLDKKAQELIETGIDCEDRSLGAYLAAIAMVKKGFSDDEILTVLTDRSYFLGDVGFDHAKTSSRDRAALWISRYSLAKAKMEHSPVTQFEAVPLPPPLEVKELVRNWQNDLEYNDAGKPKNTVKNVRLILANSVEGMAGPIIQNEFLVRDLYRADTPWGGRKGRELADIDLIRIKLWVAEHFRFEPSTDRINEAVLSLAHENSFHPVKDYLESLTWDGESRIENWLKDYANAEEPSEYLKAVSRLVLCGLVARVYHPGIKFDYVMILEGKQGLMKSTLLEALAGREWFTDQEFNIHDKDAVMTIQGKWIVELGELSSMRRADFESLKSFITRTIDRIRLPYGKKMGDMPRQGLFIGSTNQREYLNDPTGNRRFLPVKIGQCRPKELAKVRDQLFAEAKFLYDLGEPLYFTDSKVVEQAFEAQTKREKIDLLFDQAQEYFDEQKMLPEKDRKFDIECFTLSEVMGAGFGPLGTLTTSGTDTGRAGTILRKLGYEVHLCRRKGKRARWWMRGVTPVGV